MHELELRQERADVALRINGLLGTRLLLPARSKGVCGILRQALIRRITILDAPRCLDFSSNFRQVVISRGAIFVGQSGLRMQAKDYREGSAGVNIAKDD